MAFPEDLLSSFPEVADACQVVRRAELHAPSFLVAYPSYQVEDLPSCLVVVPFPLGACRDGHPLEEQEPEVEFGVEQIRQGHQHPCHLAPSFEEQGHQHL